MPSKPTIAYRKLFLKNEYLILVRDCLLDAKFSTPENVLSHVLQSYIDNQPSPGVAAPKIFINTPNHHKAFAQNLLSQLFDKDFDLIKVLNTYLESTKLDINGEFTSLLIAYFFYFKNIYIDLASYDALKKQIIIPLAIFKKEKLKADIGYFLKNIGTDNPKLRINACKMIENIPIPTEKLSTVVAELLQHVNDEDFLADKHDLFISNIPVYRDVFNALAKIEIPIEMHEIIIDDFLKEIKQKRIRSHWGECFNFIQKLTISTSKRTEAIQCLLIRIDTFSKDNQQPTWDLLNIWNIPLELKNEWISQKLQELNSDDASSVKHACYQLAACNVPNDRRREVLDILLKVADVNDRAEPTDYKIRDALIHCFSHCMPHEIGDYHKIVVQKLLNYISDDDQRNHNAIIALRQIDIPSDLQINVTKVLLNEIATKEHPWPAYKTLSTIKIPQELHDEIVTQLIVKLDSDNSDIMPETFGILANFGSSGSLQKKILMKFIEILKNKEFQATHYLNSLCLTINKMRIPLKIGEDIINEILNIIKHKTLINGPMDGVFTLIKEIVHTEKQGKDFINALVNMFLGNVYQLITQYSYDSSNVDDVIPILEELQKNISCYTTIKLQACLNDLEARIDEKLAPEVFMKIRVIYYRLECINHAKAMLYQSLPVELASHILRFA